MATYIPELGKANPDWFGICVVTCDGQVYEVGDTRQTFTIQSISKPITYGIAHMLRNFDIFEENPLPSLEAYFQQCSILVNCLDLAFIGATLANDGLHPVTGQRAVGGVYVESILSVMASCGMYDAADEWLDNVDMPAKSGVGGGILAVLTGQLAVAVFSPLLDAHGNSVRGIAVCREISAYYNLHLLTPPIPACPSSGTGLPRGASPPTAPAPRWRPSSCTSMGTGLNHGDPGQHHLRPSPQ